MHYSRKTLYLHGDTSVQRWRNFLFFLLHPHLVCSEKATDNSENNDDKRNSNTYTDAITDPKAIISLPITPCEVNSFVTKRPCYDFLWSGAGKQRLLEGLWRIILAERFLPRSSSFDMHKWVNCFQVLAFLTFLLHLCYISKQFD